MFCQVLLEHDGAAGAVGTLDRSILTVLLMLCPSTKLDDHGATWIGSGGREGGSGGREWRDGGRE